MPLKKGSISLNVPNNLDCIPIVQDCIAGVSRMMGFKEDEINKIQIGVEEAVTNVITHAFDPGEEASYEVVCQSVPLGLKIIVRDKGLPFDPKQIPEYKPDAMREKMSDAGLGVYLMKQCLDEVSFHNLGPDGMETHLVKYLAHKGVEEYLEEHEIAQAKQAHKEAPEKREVSYNVRRMKLDEAVEVSRCAYFAYGYSYANDHIYYPDRVRALNSHEDIVSFVAVEENGEIMGHAALEFNQEDRRTAEIGIAFVKPKYRGLGCLNRLGQLRLDFAEKRDLVGLISQAVSTHPFSQKALHKYNFSECAVFLSRAPSLEFKDIKAGGAQRESLVAHFLYVHKPKMLTIYPPPQHTEMIEKILERTGVNYKRGSADSSQKLPNRHAEIKTVTDKFAAANIRVKVYGLNTITDVARNLKGLCVDRLETIYLHLPLSDPLTPMVCMEFEKMGFFFSGIMPGTVEGSLLILQYLNNQKLDYDKIATASDLGGELVDYIRSRDPSQGLISDSV